MKLLVLLFLILPFSGNIPEAPLAILSEPSVTVSVELTNGAEITETFPISQASKVLAEKLNLDPSEVIGCIAITPSGECMSRAETCAEAVAQTIACIKRQQ